jgi:pyridoxamine 5'-phosphate oxidase
MDAVFQRSTGDIFDFGCRTCHCETILNRIILAAANPIPPPIAVVNEFRSLLQAATDAGDPEPTAMTIASSTLDGRISARTVLLKAVDDRGFVFYTNYASNKGRQLQENPQAALLFLWKTLQNQVQVKIEGVIERVTDNEADQYFSGRGRDSQIGAWASLQSQTLDSRDVLSERIATFERQFANQPVPRPPHWSGFRVLPTMIEFWFGAAHRLHERTRHEYSDGAWSLRKLYP